MKDRFEKSRKVIPFPEGTLGREDFFKQQISSLQNDISLAESRFEDVFQDIENKRVTLAREENEKARNALDAKYEEILREARANLEDYKKNIHGEIERISKKLNP